MERYSNIAVCVRPDRKRSRMRSHLILLAFVGLAFASSQPGWKDNTEYIYIVNGRTLTSLPELSDQYSGIFLKAKLHVSSRPDGKLQAYISDAQYAQIHSQLPNSWNTYIPDSQLSYKELGLSSKPFWIIFKSGVIKSLTVEKGVANWEANVIKSIVSQFQLDLRGKNVVESPINNLPSKDKLEGVFKTMEETVTGEAETEYDIHRFPEYLIQSEPWLVPQYKLKGNGEIYEVIKTKNYTNSRDMPVYHYGFGDITEGAPTSNKMGHFFTRQSSSRVILAGKPSKYTVQSSQTVNKIIVYPSLHTSEQGSVISAINLTLFGVKSQSQPPQELSNPMEIGCLVYTYDIPFAKSNKVHQKLPGKKQLIKQLQGDDSSSSSSASSEEIMQYETRPTMSEAPESPLLPYYIGYLGNSIKTNREFDIKQNVKRIAKEISEDLQQPERTLSQSTLSKYSILCSLIRLMNQEEIRSVAEEVYHQEKQGQQYLVWVAFRDAVSDAGTGPAFLNIEEWISTKKIEGDEACQAVASMAYSVRTPTEEYVQKFFELVKSQLVRQQPCLNESSLFAFTRLLNKVYINKYRSENQYPIYSFGTFYTKSGEEFVKFQVIPYLSQQLAEAVSQGNSRQIHTYIRALGNVGHKTILEVFEPYLEGQKQMSQFQRMLIVLSLDKLATAYPTVARSVLYRIYQNIAEVPEVRVVAVYQLMRTNPPSEMLQRMAQNTNNDAQEEVNAAVKSAIENACQLESIEAESLRHSAESARPFLSKKEYGQTQSLNLLQEFSVKNIHAEFKQNLLQVGSTDHMLPKGFKYTLRRNLSGMKHYLFNIQTVFSSIKELMNVAYMQTEQYQTSGYQKSGENKWSSAKIAESLNVETNEREQLEGFIYSEMETLQRIWSFDNETVQQMPEAIRQIEQALKNGKAFYSTRFSQSDEMALSFPTEMGLPFLYTYDIPVLIRLEGNMKANANPEISKENKLHKPEQISAEIDGYFTYSRKVNCYLSVVTPFDQQIYTSGFDKKAQIHLPLQAKVEVDLQKYQAEFQWKLNEKHDNARLFHYSTWPFTSRSDIISLSPVVLRPNTHRVDLRSDNQKSYNLAWGNEQSGVKFRVWGHHSQKSVNLLHYVNSIQSEGFSNAFQKVCDDFTLKHSEINVKFEQYTSPKITFKFGFQNQYSSKPQAEKQEEFLSMDQLSSKVRRDSQQWYQEFLRHVSAGIKSSWANCITASLEYEGNKKYYHEFTLAYAKSNVAPQCSLVALYNNNAQTPYELCLQLKGYVPNTSEMDLTHSVNTDPRAKYDALLEYRQNKQKSSKLSAVIDMSRSHSRKNQLEKQPLYYLCKNEMHEGNYQLNACQNMTIESNYLDYINAELEYENIHSEYEEGIKRIFQIIQVANYPWSEIRNVQTGRGNKVQLEIQFEPEYLQQVNVSIKADAVETEFYNISLNHWARTVLVPHPMYNLKERFIGQFMRQDNIRPTCIIDENVGQTFNNQTYPLSLGDGWTLMMQYIPQQARVTSDHRVRPDEQLRDQQENFVVLVRKISEHNKEVKITFNLPTSSNKMVEINLQQKQQGSVPTVFVDGQEIQFNENTAANLFNGFVEIYALPSEEVKIEIQNWFYMVFDGERVKLTAVSDKLRDSIIGLCGRFSGDRYEDMWTPRNCIVKSPKQFVENFKVENRQSQQTQQCIRKELPLYTDVITNSDVDKHSAKSVHEGHVASEVKLRNRYVEQNGEICFTIHPVPECKDRVHKTITKDVPVYCVSNSKTAYYFKNQIDRGGNPDFSHKSASKTIQLEIPQDCY